MSLCSSPTGPSVLDTEVPRWQGWSSKSHRRRGTGDPSGCSVQPTGDFSSTTGVYRPECGLGGSGARRIPTVDPVTVDGPLDPRKLNAVTTRPVLPECGPRVVDDPQCHCSVETPTSLPGRPSVPTDIRRVTTRVWGQRGPRPKNFRQRYYVRGPVRGFSSAFDLLTERVLPDGTAGGRRHPAGGTPVVS